MTEPRERPEAAAPRRGTEGRPLLGQHAVVTGAARGIGAEIARALGRMGADLTLIGRHRAGLQARAEEIARGSGVSARAAEADVSDEARVADAFAAGREAHGPVSILVSNAGIAASAPLQKTGRELWDSMLGVNLTGAFLCARAALPDMLAAGYGRVVNVASTAGLKGYAYVSAYCAAKHGVVGLTRALARETAAKGVTVNAVCPGYTETDLVRDAVGNIVAKTGRTAEEAAAELASANPQGRLVRPEEVAQAVSWLVLPGSGAVTGLAVAVAGGETA